MCDQQTLDAAIAQLHPALGRMRLSPIWQQIVVPQERVYRQFQPLFRADHLPHLTKAEFGRFLNFSNNCHWTGLHRQVNKIGGDMPTLRTAMLALADDTRPISLRFDAAVNAVHGMREGIASAILIIMFPAKYGVWNATSERWLRALNLWPTFDWGSTRGARYQKVNTILNKLAAALKIDLWTLDALWWQLNEDEKQALGQR